jgi:hypothetical protein
VKFDKQMSCYPTYRPLERGQARVSELIGRGVTKLGKLRLLCCGRSHFFPHPLISLASVRAIYVPPLHCLLLGSKG